MSRASQDPRRRLCLEVLLSVALAAAAPGPVRFAVIGDRTGGAQPGIYEQVVSEVEKEGPEFVISVGDQIEGYSEDTTTLNAQWREYKAIVSRLSMPVYLVPGNHDIATSGQLHSYITNAGQPYYSFDRKGMHFVVLDASRWESSDRLPCEQLDWLAADLGKSANSRYTFVFYHRPYWDGTTDVGNPDTLHKLFLRYGVDAVFAGHAHSYSSGTYDGIRYTVVGSSGAAAESGPTGILYHHLLVDAGTGGITITPVLLGGERREWDDVTDEDLRSFAPSRPPVLRLAAPVVVGPDLKVRGTTTVVVTNPSLTDSLKGMLTWDTPAGWTVGPAEVVVSVQPDARVEKVFEVQNSGRLSPVPAACLVTADAPGSSARFKRSLRVVRVAEAMPTAEPPVGDRRQSGRQVLAQSGHPPARLRRWAGED